MSFEGVLHNLARSALAGPDLKLRDGLFEEHFRTWNHYCTLLFRMFKKYGVARIVNHVEHDFSWNPLWKETFLCIRYHAHRSGVNECVELLALRLLDSKRFSLHHGCKSLRLPHVTTGHGYLCTSIVQSHRRGARSSSITGNQH